MSKNELNQMDQLQAENAALRAERANALALLEGERKLTSDLGNENQRLAIRLHAAQATTRVREHELEKLRVANALLRAEIEQLKHRLDLRGCAMALHQVENAVREMATNHSERDLEKATPSRLPTIGPEEC